MVYFVSDASDGILTLILYNYNVNYNILQNTSLYYG